MACACLAVVGSASAAASATVTSAAMAANASVPALIPMPREMKLTGGSVACVAANSPKVEVIASIPPEGYELSITKDGVTIRHSDDAGLFYAKVTLGQLKDATKRDFAEFSVRAAEHRRRLIREHVNCAPLK